MTRLLLIVTGLAAAAVVLQTSVLSAFAVNQMVPQLALLVVVAVGLSRDAHAGIAAGFVAGLMLDLAPPADHAAGRWALALLLAGFVAGQVGQSAYRVRPLLALITTAVCSLVATVTFALTGVLTSEPTGLALGQVLTGVGLNLLVAPLVLPWAMRLFDRIATPRSTPRATPRASQQSTPVATG